RHVFSIYSIWAGRFVEDLRILISSAIPNSSMMTSDSVLGVKYAPTMFALLVTIVFFYLLTVPLQGCIGADDYGSQVSLGPRSFVTEAAIEILLI
ncbi:hypothetical protein L9F63_018145, partial [Diploptera punctata]